ncbi:MAG: phage-shock protein [Candidatus Hydrogenedens sp.]|nr:phage-shock protein [Candidatus Hydrogenedens sp.]
MSPFTFVLALIGLIMYFIYKMASIGVNRNDAAYNPEETEMIQAMHKQLLKMEERVESLETLLVERTERENTPTFREVMKEQQRGGR